MSFPMTSSGLPYLSKGDMEYLAEEHSKAFSRFVGKEDFKFSVWKFAAHYLKQRVSFEWLSFNGCYLGASSFINGTLIPIYIPETDDVIEQAFDADTILLDKTLEKPTGFPWIQRFTLMHECAHQLLHKDHFRMLAASGIEETVAYSARQNQTPPSMEQDNQQWTIKMRREWQANYLAGALLMPESRVDRALEKHQIQEEYFQRVLDRRSEREAYEHLIYRLASVFLVSPMTARIRLEALGFERLPDIQGRKTNSFDQYAQEHPPVKKLTKAEERQEKIWLRWEKRLQRERGG